VAVGDVFDVYIVNFIYVDPFFDKEGLFCSCVFDKCDHSLGEMKLEDSKMRLSSEGDLMLDKLICHI